MENSLVVKANKLVEARYNLNLNEQKVLLYAISKLDREKPDMDWIELDLKEIAELTGTHGKRYEDFRETVRSLRQRELIVDTEDRELITGWLTSIRIYKHTGKVVLKFDDELIPYLLQIQNRFTRYQLKNILHLKNKYSIRIYELLKQREDLMQRDFDLEELKQILGCEDKYTDFKNFNRFVLDKTKAEINEHTDILTDYEKVKRGRKVVGIRYSIQNKEAQYIEYLNQTYDIPEFKQKSGLDKEKWNSKQIMELYTIACKKTKNEDVDVFDYIRLNYIQMLQNESVRNGFGYLKDALEKDYAVAVGQLKMGYEVDLSQ